MATFKFGRYIDIHWNGYDIQGPADTVFSIPDQLYEEFDGDIAPVEPTLVWIDTNEFQTLQNSVPNYTIAATSPIAISSSTDTAGAVTKTWSLNANYSTSTHDHSGTYQPAGTYVNAVVGSSPATVSTSSGTATVSISSGTAADGYVLTSDGAGGVAFEASTGGIGSLVATSPLSASVSGSSATVSINSGTNPNGYLMAADGSGGVIFTPASTSGLTSVVGVAPMSTTISGGTVSVILNASYQTAGTYASSVSATSPISATLSTAGVLSVSIDSAATSAENARRTRSLVRNSTVSTIAKGSFVYIDGSNGTVPTIQKALATTDATSARTFGIVEADIASNSNGYVTNQGLITGVDTSGFADGDVLWLSTTISGAATTTKPTGPNHGVLLGIVVKGGSVGAGEIYIFIKNGSELDEIHDVNISGLANGDTLIWSSTASVWQNQTLANAGISASTHTHNYVSTVIGTSPASVSTASGTATVSIVAGSINSTHLSATSVGSSQLVAQSVTTAKIGSGVATSGTVLTSDGAGGASFAVAAGFSLISSQTISTGVSTASKPANAKIAYLRLVSGGGGGNNRRSTSSNTSGTSGGYGGGRVEFWVSASDFSSTINYSIGAGGSGAVSASFTSATIATLTVSGTAGGTTSFGSYSIAPQKQIPYSDANEAAPGTAGTQTNDTTGDASGGYSGYLTAGGGSSGGLNATRGIGAASVGGTILSKWSAITAGGGASAGTASTGATGSGTNGSTATTAGGGGGAGGGKLSTVTLTANVSSGNGGNGLYPGGGGGAGGLLAFSNATTLGAFTATVGSGGNGADGQIYVEWYG